MRWSKYSTPQLTARRLLVLRMCEMFEGLTEFCFVFRFGFRATLLYFTSRVERLHLCYYCAYVQGYNQESAKGDKPGGLGTEVPSGVQGQSMETLENTNGAVTKIDLRWRGSCTHAPSGYAPVDVIWRVLAHFVANTVAYVRWQPGQVRWSTACVCRSFHDARGRSAVLRPALTVKIGLFLACCIHWCVTHY